MKIRSLLLLFVFLIVNLVAVGGSSIVMQEPPLAIAQMTVQSTISNTSVENKKKAAVCKRVLPTVRGNQKKLSLINRRLQKQFGFTCSLEMMSEPRSSAASSQQSSQSSKSSVSSLSHTEQWKLDCENELNAASERAWKCHGAQRDALAAGDKTKAEHYRKLKCNVAQEGSPFWKDMLDCEGMKDFMTKLCLEGEIGEFEMRTHWACEALAYNERYKLQNKEEAMKWYQKACDAGSKKNCNLVQKGF